MWRYKLIKATRRVRILLGGFKEMEKQHKLFQLEQKFVDPKFISYTLLDHGYFYNTLSTTFNRQIYTARKLKDSDYQIHLRFYSNGWISGHFELRPDSHSLEHLDGIHLRPLYHSEKEELKSILLGETNWGRPHTRK